MRAKLLPSLIAFLNALNIVSPSEILRELDPSWLIDCPWIDKCEFQFGHTNYDGYSVIVCTCPDGSASMLVYDEFCDAEISSHIATSTSALNLTGIDWY